MTNGPERCDVTPDGVLQKGTVGYCNFSVHADGRSWNISNGPATDDKAQMAYSNQPYASGPIPHSRWLMGDKYLNGTDQFGNPEGYPYPYKVSAGPYTVDVQALASADGGIIRVADTADPIVDDDNAGNVKLGGPNFCVAAHSGAALEVWAGLLSPSSGQPRWAVAMVNRSPGDDRITLDFTKLPDLHVVGLQKEDMQTAEFLLQDVWWDTNHTNIAGPTWSREVGTHDTALLIITKLNQIQ